MSFLSRLFGKKETCHSAPPNERAMQNVLQEAKRQNKEAADQLSAVTHRQVQDAELIRQVVSDLLDRTDKRKAAR